MEQLDEINRCIGHLSGKMEGLKDSQDRTCDILERIDGRLSCLEKKELQREAKVVTIATVFSTIISLAGVFWSDIRGTVGDK